MNARRRRRPDPEFGERLLSSPPLLLLQKAGPVYLAPLKIRLLSSPLRSSQSHPSLRGKKALRSGARAAQYPPLSSSSSGQSEPLQICRANGSPPAVSPFLRNLLTRFWEHGENDESTVGEK